MDRKPDIEKHVNSLNSFCRICHGFVKKTYKKENFAEEINSIFGVDVRNEQEEIFPSYICKSCSRHLYRFRETKGDSLSTCKELKSITLKVYSPHIDDCEICLPRISPGRPRKKKKTVTTTESDHSRQASSTIDDQSEVMPDQSIESDPSAPADSSVPVNEIEILALLKHMERVIPNIPKEQTEIFFGKFLEMMTPETVSVLCNCLGRKQRDPVFRDADTFFLMYRDMEAISNFKILNWLMNRDASVLSYLFGLCGHSICNFKALEDGPNDVLLMSRALEQLYILCSRKLISPVSFLMSLSVYEFTGSKVVVDMLGNAHPSAHYKTIARWLKDQGSQPLTYPACDLMNVFDNEQVIGKTYSIKPQNKVSVSVITNKGFVKLDSEETLQTKASLKPEPLLKFQGEFQNEPILESTEKANRKAKLKVVIHDIIDQVGEKYSKMETDHNEQLYHFINHAIEVVLEDQRLKGQNYEDSIDEQIKKDNMEENYIHCQICGTVNGKRKIVCTGCKEKDGLKRAKDLRKSAKPADHKKETVQKIIFEDDEENTEVRTEFTQFSQVSSNHKGKHELFLTDPVFCNPNSIVTIARVLRKIGKENDIVRYGGKRRYWTFVCCDGLPYMIIKKLKEEALVCAIPGCAESFLSSELYNKHANQSHEEMPKKFIYEFDWLYLRIGTGHYEMNLIKSFFELNWVPVLETLCEEMGFESDAAKQFAKSCKDHHKSWRLLLIFHLGTLQELVLPYVRHCLLSKQLPTAKGFLSYNAETYSSREYPNFTYLMDQVCKFSQGIINLRMATRRNNASLLRSAKYMTKEIFHGRSHPKYQIIELYDTIQDQMMPEEVRQLNDMYASITTSGNYSLGEDFDFILEEKNKQLKSWIPKGMPTDAIWQTVCRNNKILEKIKEQSLSIFGIPSNKGTTRPLGIDDAVTAYRAILRRNDYLGKGKDHISLSGMALDEGLVDFIKEAVRKRINILKSEFLGIPHQQDQYKFRHPVPITPAEREKFQSDSNMTIKEIQNEVSKLLDKIDDPFQFDYHKKIYQQEVKTKGKAKLLHFLQELKNVLENLQVDNAQDMQDTNQQSNTCNRYRV